MQKHLMVSAPSDRGLKMKSGSHYKSTLLFTHQAMFDSVRPHGLQHTRLPCPSPSPGICSNSCPSSQWCHPTISSSVIPFSSCLPSFPASESFQMGQFSSGGQRIRVSASTSVLPMNIQGWFPQLRSLHQLFIFIFFNAPRLCREWPQSDKSVFLFLCQWQAWELKNSTNTHLNDLCPEMSEMNMHSREIISAGTFSPWQIWMAFSALEMHGPFTANKRIFQIG